MNLLAIDTAANLCAVAVYDMVTGTVRAETGEDIGKGHAERLMPMVDAVLHSAGAAISEVGKVAVAVGPGSFTGIRVGVAAARGLGLALDCPVVGVTTLETLAADAHGAFAGRRVMAAIDARRGEVYAQGFDAEGNPEGEPRVLAAEEAARRLAATDDLPVVTGSAASLIAGLLDGRTLDIASRIATGSIAMLARIGAGREPGAPPAPLYLRAPDAKPQAGFAIARVRP